MSEQKWRKQDRSNGSPNDIVLESEVAERLYEVSRVRGTNEGRVLQALVDFMNVSCGSVPYRERARTESPRRLLVASLFHEESPRSVEDYVALNGGYAFELHMMSRMLATFSHLPNRTRKLTWGPIALRNPVSNGHPARGPGGYGSTNDGRAPSGACS